VVAIGKRPGLDLQALRSLRAELKSRATDVMHTHNAVAHYYAAAAAAALGISRVINTRHGMGPARPSPRLDRLYRAALLGTHAAVSVCQAVRDGFVQSGVIPSSKALVIPNGVALADIEVRTAQAKSRLLAMLGRPTTSVVLGTVGRLSPVKDHATLLKAIRLLQFSGRTVELVVAGDGEVRASLEALTQSLHLGERVHFLGMRQDVAQLLSAFDVFVLSSMSEGYSLALVEAAAAGLPIVATRVGGNADIVADGYTGLLAPAQDPEALAAALAVLVDDAALRERMGSASRQWALRHGSIEAMGKAYLALYVDPTDPADSADPADPADAAGDKRFCTANGHPTASGIDA
jgi:glycosyltransferase involved in cell wall biosynthesis